MASGKPVRIALLGAGERGQVMFGIFVEKHPELFEYVAVAEPNDERRERFVRRFGISEENAFSNWRELLEKPQLADAVINAMPDMHHYESTILSLRKGYHVLLEKPMAQTPGECVSLAQEAEKQGLILQIFLECRYLELYQRMKQLIDTEAIGRVMGMQATENLGYWHFIMSYVRGFARRSVDVISFLSAKGIHDFDLLTWFAGSRPVKVSSFGELTHFRPENAPKGAPERCMDGCPIEDTCQFHAYRQYIKPGFPQIPPTLLTGITPGTLVDGYIKYPYLRSLAMYNLVSTDKKGRIEEIKTGPHGRCVYRCDNDVMDHQVINVQYDGGIMASLSLSAFSVTWERTLNINGTTGELYSKDFTGTLQMRTFNPKISVKRKRVRFNPLFHGGSDGLVLIDFAKSVQRKQAGTSGEILTGVQDAVDSHLLCFAAEEARKNDTVVDMVAFTEQAEKEARKLSV